MFPTEVLLFALAAVAIGADTTTIASTSIAPGPVVTSSAAPTTIIQTTIKIDTTETKTKTETSTSLSTALVSETGKGASSNAPNATSSSNSTGAAVPTNVAQFGALLGLGVPVMLGLL